MENEFNNTSNDDLARMIAMGFDGVDERLDKVDERLNKIEALLLGDYKKRIEKLELEMKELRQALVLK